MHKRGVYILSIIEKWKKSLSGSPFTITIEELKNYSTINIIPQNSKSCRLDMWISIYGGMGFSLGEDIRFEDDDEFYSDDKKFLLDILNSVYLGKVEEIKWCFKNGKPFKSEGTIFLEKTPTISTTRYYVNVFNILIGHFRKKYNVIKNYAPY